MLSIVAKSTLACLIVNRIGGKSGRKGGKKGRREGAREERARKGWTKELMESIVKSHVHCFL